MIAEIGPPWLYVAAIVYASVMATLARLVEIKREERRAEVVRE